MSKKKLFRVITTVGIFVILSCSISMAKIYPNLSGDSPKPYIIKGIVSIQLEDNVDVSSLNKAPFKAHFNIPSLDAVLSKNDINVAKSIFPFITKKPKINSGEVDLTRFYELQFSEDLDVNQVVKDLLADPNIRMAEAVWAMPIDASPDDPQWDDQWCMLDFEHTPHFSEAWDYEKGSDSIKIADIDTGVLYTHADLADNIWVNPGEDIDGDGVVFDPDDLNGIDDDGNGYVDDLIGYDFLTSIGAVWPGEDGGTPDPDPLDFNGHGTHIAGIVAAVNNNGINVTGIAGGWAGGHKAFRGSRIMCLRIAATGDDGRGYGNPNNAATAIAYSIMMGANAINYSFTGGSSVVAAAANNAIAAGITFCHSAGNDDEGDTPAAEDLVDGVLSVAATNYADARSEFSNYGSYVDVSAPGTSILSTVSNQYTPSTATYNGTSMASPMVAGLSALIRSAMPSLTGAQVDSIIIHSAESVNFYIINPLYNNKLGSGRIDALAALSGLANAKFTADVTQGEAPLEVQFTDLSPNSPVAWDWSFGNGDVSTDQNPIYTYNDVGIYSVSLIEDENHPLGMGEEHLKNYIWVTGDTIKIGEISDYVESEIIVPVYLYNTDLVKEITISFTYTNSANVKFISVSTTGLRSDYFESVKVKYSDILNKRASVTLKTNVTGGSQYLPQGGGNIVNLHFLSDDVDAVIDIDTATFTSGSTLYTSKIKTIWGDYWPKSHTPGSLTIDGIRPAELVEIGPKEIDENSLLSFEVFATSGRPTITLYTSTLPFGASFDDNGDGSGLFSWTPHFLQNGDYEVTFYADDGVIVDNEVVNITVIDMPCCLNNRGNANGDFADALDVDDLIYMVDYAFNGGDEPLCPEEGDVAPLESPDGVIDVDDLIFMVNYAFSGGDSPGPCIYAK